MPIGHWSKGPTWLVCEGRRVVVLAEPGRGVAVGLQDRADGRLVLGDDAVVAGIAGGGFADDAEADRVVVAAGDQRGAGRRAERRGVELRVAQARARDPVEVRRRDDAAEGARRAEALVVDQDQEDVGRAFRRHDLRLPVGRRTGRVEVDHAAECAGGGGSCRPSIVAWRWANPGHRWSVGRWP